MKILSSIFSNSPMANYPGTEGTCGSSLAAGASCTIAVTMNVPPGLGNVYQGRTFTGTIILGYTGASPTPQFLAERPVQMGLGGVSNR